MHQDFILKWNLAETSTSTRRFYEQTDALPGKAWSGMRGSRTWIVYLPSEKSHLEIYLKAPWEAWHSGWSFLRHRIDSVQQIRKVMLCGSVEDYNCWACDIGIPLL